MVKAVSTAVRVSQEAFDEVVKENMEDFGMEAEEAVADAVAQFEAQGVDLRNIVRSAGKHPVVTISESLVAAAAGGPASAGVADTLRQLINTATEGSVRCLAGEQGAVRAVVQIGSASEEKELVLLALQALQALLMQCLENRDRVKAEGLKWIVHVIGSDDAELRLHALQCFRLSCMRNEANRCEVMDRSGGCASVLVGAVTAVATDVAAAKAAAKAVRVLTLDDDLRADLPKAHERAKAVFEAGALAAFIEVITVQSEEPAVLAEVFRTLASLAVNDEFCKAALKNADLLSLCLSSLDAHGVQSEELSAAACECVRGLCRNEEARDTAASLGAFPKIVAVATHWHQSGAVLEASCGAIGNATLRRPSNAQLVAECGGLPILASALRSFPENVRVCRQSSLAIRNCSVRNPENRPVLLELGVEPLLRSVADRIRQCADEAKYALRDLGLEVALRQEWEDAGLPSLKSASRARPDAAVMAPGVIAEGDEE